MVSGDFGVGEDLSFVGSAKLNLTGRSTCVRRRCPHSQNAQADDADGVLTAEGDRTEEELRIFWRRRLMPGEQGTLFEDDIN